MNYDAIVFDVDGVLVEPADRETLETGVRRAFRSLDVSTPSDEHVEEMAIHVTVDTVREVCAAYDLDPDTFWRERDRRSSAVQREAIRAGRKPLYDDLDVLNRLDHPKGIVSANQQMTIDYILDHFDFNGTFETAYGREPGLDGLRRKKPDPYYLESAIADLDADTALFVGDSESDVQAAHRAGVDAAFLQRPHRADYALEPDPEYEIETLAKLLDIA
ncbi:MAG: phosphoglycolate phosphatase [Halobacteriales archaeon]|jgi:phosphoglycolate phosphatase